MVNRAEIGRNVTVFPWLIRNTEGALNGMWRFSDRAPTLLAENCAMACAALSEPFASMRRRGWESSNRCAVLGPQEFPVRTEARFRPRVRAWRPAGLPAANPRNAVRRWRPAPRLSGLSARVVPVPHAPTNCAISDNHDGPIDELTARFAQRRRVALVSVPNEWLSALLPFSLQPFLYLPVEDLDRCLGSRSRHWAARAGMKHLPGPVHFPCHA